MKYQENTFELLFQEYGTLQLLEEDTDQNRIYKFSCNPKTICTKENLFYNFEPIVFAIVIEPSGECHLICFRVGSKDDDSGNTLYIVNEVNKGPTYGKFILDSDNDVNWEFSFDINNIDSYDLKNILISFFDSLYQFVYLKIRGKHE